MKLFGAIAILALLVVSCQKEDVRPASGTNSMPALRSDDAGDGTQDDVVDETDPESDGGNDIQDNGDGSRGNGVRSGRPRH